MAFVVTALCCTRFPFLEKSSACEIMNTVATPTLSEIELADNPDPRCACVLLLDTSGSTAAPSIDAINKGLHQLKAELQEDSVAAKRVEFAVVGFGQKTKLRSALPGRTRTVGLLVGAPFAARLLRAWRSHCLATAIAVFLSRAPVLRQTGCPFSSR
jgi:hypothetical protein